MRNLAFFTNEVNSSWGIDRLCTDIRNGHSILIATQSFANRIRRKGWISFRLQSYELSAPFDWIGLQLSNSLWLDRLAWLHANKNLLEGTVVAEDETYSNFDGIRPQVTLLQYAICHISFRIAKPSRVWPAWGDQLGNARSRNLFDPAISYCFLKAFYLVGCMTLIGIF